MKQKLILLLTILLTVNTYSQIEFEAGYYIDNSGEKVEAFIKNEDWKYNPVRFEFKISENGNPQTADLRNVREFGISNTSRYLRRKVKIDRSSENLNNLDKVSTPFFQEEELFLKLLVEGKANLYEYSDVNLRRYFYSAKGSDIEQLIFKKYKTEENKIANNTSFRQQLWNNLKCEDIKRTKIETLEYKKDDLVKLFSLYSKCSNEELVYVEQKEKRDLFILSLRPRVNYSSLTIKNPLSNIEEIEFDSKTGFGLGIEAEFILPYNKNKWSVIIEPTFQSFNSENTKEAENVSGGALITEVNYSSVEVPVGIRHYFFLDDNSKIFLNSSYVFDLNFSSSIDFTRNDGSNYNSLDVKTGSNFAFGLGYKQNDKYSFELRYLTSRDILVSYSAWSSNYPTISLIFGYSIF